MNLAFSPVTHPIEPMLQTLKNMPYGVSAFAASLSYLRHLFILIKLSQIFLGFYLRQEHLSAHSAILALAFSLKESSFVKNWSAFDQHIRWGGSFGMSAVKAIIPLQVRLYSRPSREASDKLISLCQGYSFVRNPGHWLIRSFRQVFCQIMKEKLCVHITVKETP